MANRSHLHPITEGHLADLRERIRAIVPDAEVWQGYGGRLWVKVRTPGGWKAAATIQISGDGDLARGPLHRMGMSVEQRRAVARAVVEWRATKL